MIFIMLIEASFVLLAFKHFGRLTWQRLLSAGIMLQAVTAYCSLPLMVGNELSGPQLMKLQLVTVTWRQTECFISGTFAWLRMHQYPGEHHSLLMAFICLSEIACLCLTAVASWDIASRYHSGRPILPSCMPLDYPPEFWAAELGNHELLQKVAPETLKAADNNGDLPAHVAAQNGHEVCL